MAWKKIDTGISRKHGQCSLAVKDNRLFIVFPRTCFGGKQRTLSLKLSDTPNNRATAIAKLNLIQNDIDLGQFDPTLERYKPQMKQAKYKPIFAQGVTLLALWTSYLDYKKPTLKETTLDYLENTLQPHIIKSGVTSPYDALELRKQLFNQTTQSMTKRILTYVKAAFDWGKNHKLVRGDNPYEGMARELKHGYEIESTPNAFTSEEKEEVIRAFEEHKYYRYYADFVKFLFLTGCRPYEAIGLRWIDISNDLKKVKFDGGIQKLSNSKFVRTKRSKNNKIREFPCNENLRQFLRSLWVRRQDDLVFPSPKGKAIDYDDFSRNAWNKVVDPIKPDTTPYCCRDTFITEQVAKGINPAIVAIWVDNSVATIERHYLDPLKLSKIHPI